MVPISQRQATPTASAVAEDSERDRRVPRRLLSVSLQVREFMLILFLLVSMERAVCEISCGYCVFILIGLYRSVYSKV